MTASEDRSWSRRVPSDDGDAAGGRPTPLSPGSAAEPLIYQTVQRVPGSDGQFRPRRSTAERREEPELPPTEALPTQDVPRYRPRDFSPEGRRAVPSWAPTAGQADAPLSERLDYHTLTRAEVRAAAERFGATDSTGSGDGGTGADGAGSDGAGTDGDGTHSSSRSDEDGSGAGSGVSGTGAPAPGGAGIGGGIPAGPVSTPDQPLTRRQLRALREAQEAEHDAPESGGEQRSDDVAGDGPAARPWAPVFYGEPVRTNDADPATASSESMIDADSADGSAESTEDPGSGVPSWSGSAPATFAIPVISEADPSRAESADPDLASDAEPDAHGTADAPAPDDRPALDDAPASDDALARDDTSAPSNDAASGGASAPADAFPLQFSSPSASPAGPTEDAPARSLDDWVAGLYAGQPPADDRPLELVEPPEPERWDGDAESEAPTVLDDLFSPPAPREETGAAVAPTPDAPSESPRPVTDPLEFLDAAPAASDRVDLPAPSSWEQPTVVGQPPVEPPGSRVDEDVIPVEAQDAAPSDAAEVHPVIIDAVPLPAEPVPDAARPETPREGAVATPGAWTAHAAADDSHADVASGRDVGGGHGVVTTNALVLPSLPSPELSGPLTTTGEIVVTGSIDVPRSMSSTGAHPTQLDQSSLDHELDPGDQQVVSVDSQPVRAIKAVSTHTSTRGMMTSTKPHGNRGLTVLIIVTAGLAVVTLAVLAIGLVNNAF